MTIHAPQESVPGYRALPPLSSRAQRGISSWPIVIGIGRRSIRVNAQFRVCFIWRDGAAWDVEIVDYH